MARTHLVSEALGLRISVMRIQQATNLVQDLEQEQQMSDLVVMAFPTEAKAEEVRQKLLAMQKEYLIELGDAVIAVKDSKGNIKLINTTAAGAVTGAFWG